MKLVEGLQDELKEKPILGGAGALMGQVRYNLGLAKLFFNWRYRGISFNVANFDITSKCTLACEHCYFLRSLKEDMSDLTDEEWGKVFQAFSMERTHTVFLTGGEPALRPEVIRMADNIFPLVQIVSNCTIKIPEDIDRRIHISLDGNAETHNKIRGAKCFDRIIKNIKDDKRVTVTCTLSTSNFLQIKEVVQIAQEAGVCGVTFSLYTGTNPNDPLLLRDRVLEQTLTELNNVRKEYPDFVLLSPLIIKTFKTKAHVQNCFLRSKWVRSFYPNMQEKRPCVLGENVDCSTCGCIVPAITYAISKIDFASARVAKRLFSYDGQKRR